MRVDRSTGFRAQIGRIANAVEGDQGNDPSGILLNASMTQGNVSLLLSSAGGVATPTPTEAAGFSVPLEDAAGRRIPSIGDFLIEGWSRALLRGNPGNFAAGSKLYVFVGIMSDGTLANATQGMVWGLKNTSAGVWHVFYRLLNSGVWGSEAAPSSGLADPGGVHGVWGGPSLNYGRSFGQAAEPLLGSSAVTAARGFGDHNMSGNDPHFVFGAGWADVPPADATVIFRPLARYMPGPTADES